MAWSEELYRILGIDAGSAPTPGLFVGRRAPGRPSRAPPGMVEHHRPGLPFDAVFRIVRAGAEERWVHIRAHPENERDGDVIKAAGTLMDDTDRIHADELRRDAITGRKEMEAELAHQALHDSLTGLPNRSLLTDRLIHGLAGSRRRGSQLGVMFLDIDHFKAVNESLGHGRGDDLLSRRPLRISGAIRPGDTVARFGGDEFVIVCDDISLVEAEEIAERILEA